MGYFNIKVINKLEIIIKIFLHFYFFKCQGYQYVQGNWRVFCNSKLDYKDKKH